MKKGYFIENSILCKGEKYMKSRKMLTAILGMLMMGSSVSVMAQGQVKVRINNEVVSFNEASPFVDSNNRTLVPLRLISEKLGADVKWDSDAQKVRVISEGKEAMLIVGQSKMVVNGEEKVMDTKPVVKEGRVFVPVKYIGEVLGVETKWIAKENTVAISNELPGSTIVAKVNDEEIIARDIQVQLNYEKAMLLYQGQIDESYFETEEAKAYMKERKAEIVDYIIKNKVALVKGREMKLEPKSEEIMSEFNETKLGYGSEEAFKEALASSGLTEESYKKQISDRMTITNVIDAISKKVTATDAEIKAYYEAHSVDYVNQPGANMYHILVATKEEAEKVKAEYDKGTSFADLAKKYGTDGTKDNGGALGYIPYESRDYDKDFLEGAKTLGEGEVSKPVETQFGWHLIKVDNVHKEVYTTPLEEVKEQIKSVVITQKLTPAIYDQIEEWEAKMTVEKYEDLINKL